MISKEIAQAEHYGNGGEWDRVNQVIKSSFVIVYVSFWNKVFFLTYCLYIITLGSLCVVFLKILVLQHTGGIIN